MDTRRKSRFRKKQRQHFRKGDSRVRHANQHLARRGERAVNNDRRGRALFGASEVVWVFREGKIARLGAVSRGKTVEHQARIAQNFASEMFGYFSSSEGHKSAVDLDSLGHYKGRTS